MRCECVDLIDRQDLVQTAQYLVNLNRYASIPPPITFKRIVLMQVDHAFLLDCQYFMMCIFVSISIVDLPRSRRAAILLLVSNSPNMYLLNFI